MRRVVGVEELAARIELATMPFSPMSVKRLSSSRAIRPSCSSITPNPNRTHPDDLSPPERSRPFGIGTRPEEGDVRIFLQHRHHLALAVEFPRQSSENTARREADQSTAPSAPLRQPPGLQVLLGSEDVRRMSIATTSLAANGIDSPFACSTPEQQAALRKRHVVVATRTAQALAGY